MDVLYAAVIALLIMVGSLYSIAIKINAKIDKLSNHPGKNRKQISPGVENKIRSGDMNGAIILHRKLSLNSLSLHEAELEVKNYASNLR